MKSIVRLTSMLLGLAFAGQASATIIVDGNLGDWGINPSTWLPVSPTVNATIEDATGSGSYYLTPGYGGQAYDAEAMYATINSGKLFFALATGHNPLTANNPGANSYGAGDFAIDFGKNGSYDLGINVKPYAGFGVAAGVYSSPVWAYGLWTPGGSHDPAHPDLLHPTSLTGGNLIGGAQLAFTTVGVTGYGQKTSDLHYFYEVGVDLSLLYTAGWDGLSFNIHWTENCANDSIMVDPGNVVSAPAPLALIGLGMIGLLGFARSARPSRVR